MRSARILVTGGSGFVAGSIIRQASPEIDLHVVSRGKPLLARPGLTWHTADLSSDTATALLNKIEPAAIIHTAALADIDYCQAHQDEARLVNTGLTVTLAKECAESGTRLIFLSTDTVFSGERGNYKESDQPRAVNFYAETKIAAELALVYSEVNAVIARVALVMGLPVLGAGNSFLSRMIATLEAGKVITVPENEIRTPIDVITLGQALLELASNSFVGIMHLSGNDTVNRYELAKRIVKRLGHSEDHVKAHDPSGIPGRAVRPRDVSLKNTRARNLLSTPLCGVDEGLERVLAFQKGAK
jgi:dTDP-4-dehydrorhamnose reductase